MKSLPVVLMEQVHLSAVRAQVGERFHTRARTCHADHDADLVDVGSQGIEEQGDAGDARPGNEHGNALQTARGAYLADGIDCSVCGPKD